MSLFEEPHLEPQPEPEKPKKKKLLSIGIGAALIVAVLVTSVLAFSFGQSGKPSDNIPDAPQQEEIQTPANTDIPPDESTDTEKRRIQHRPTVRRKRLLQAASRILTHQRERINTKRTRYRMESLRLQNRKIRRSIHRRNIPARSPSPAKRSLTIWIR